MTDLVGDPGDAAPDPRALASPARLTRSALAWAAHEGGRNPFVILVTIYVFMPYFSSVMVGDPVRGQQAVATYGQWAGFIIAATAPFLGVAIDRTGPRKPWLLFVTACMAPLTWALWWARPDGSGLSVGAVIAAATALNVLFAWNELIHNSMLVRAAGLRAAHKASALALASGAATSIVLLVAVLWAFVLPGVVPWSFVPAQPLFGLSRAAHEPDRIVGPIVAVSLLAGFLPLWLFTQDAPRTGVGLGAALGDAAGALRRMFAGLRGHRDGAVFLVARMLYTDGMTALLLFSGVYAAGVMGWGTLPLLIYGVLLSVLAVAGGLAAGWFDQALGPKNAVRLEIGMTVLGLVAILGMGKDRVLFLPYDPNAHAPLWSGPAFTTLPEVVYVLIGFSNALFITASYASSRTLLTRLTPPEQTGVFFGLYALSGTATVWLGSTLVLWATAAFHAQQAGLASLAVLLALGFVGLAFVRGGGRGSTALAA